MPLIWLVPAGVGLAAGFFSYRAVDQTADSVSNATQNLLMLGAVAAALYFVAKKKRLI